MAYVSDFVTAIRDEKKQPYTPASHITTLLTHKKYILRIFICDFFKVKAIFIGQFNEYS